MIGASTVLLVAGGAHAVAFALLLLWLPRVEAGNRVVCGLVAGVVGVGSVANVLMGLGMGTLTYAGGVVLAPLFVSDLVAYTGFFVLTAGLAGASRGLLGTIAAISIVQRVAFELANGGYVSGGSALAAAGIVVVGWFVILYLFLRPVWAVAQDVPTGQRLLHWKCRNLLLFMIGMLIVFAMLILAGIFDSFVSTITSTYVGFLIRVGLAGFIFVNAEKISDSPIEPTIGPQVAVSLAGRSGE